MIPSHLAFLLLSLPLATAGLIAVCLRRQGAVAAALSVATAVGILAGAAWLALGDFRFEASREWLSIAGLRVSFGFNFNDLAALMLAIVAVVGLCVHVFSLGYMRDDPARARYFAGLSIFMFSMIGVVLADNLFMMFIFWELVGFSSWLLINHWFERPAPAAASKKAFIVNRVGDFGFLLGIIMCYHSNGTVNLSDLAVQASAGTAVYSRAIPLLLFCGAIGKSAQVPLHVWLPDAMEGPTPVSALIHAATMVAAGIYMLCRVEMLMVHEALLVIAAVGTATALYAAFCAVVQRDIKRVLAYSTLSQLGYMVAAFGLGSIGGVDENGRALVIGAGVGAAMFHLTTHAAFKALLFLCSGSVIYGCHHEQDIFKMGGLAGRMKLTFVVFTIGVAAIIGMPFFAGFFSKDAILALAFTRNKAVFAALAFTAVLTALYMVRLWRLVFFGAPRSEAASHAHEGGFTLAAPLVVLAVFSVFGGYLSLYPHAFHGVLGNVPEAAGAAHAIVFATSLSVLILGAGAAIAFYKPAATDALEQGMPAVFAGLVALQESFDAFYTWYVDKVQQRLAMVLNFIDVVGIAGLVVRGTAGVAGLAGLGARALHTGRISTYVYWFLAGVAVLWLFATGVL
jgi:NADH-quinone oxidoreductase subunit L